MIWDQALHEFGEQHPVQRHSVRQGLAWMIAAELVRRHPGVCRVVGTHPHMYDQVSVYARDESHPSAGMQAWRLIVHLNKELGGHLTEASYSSPGGVDRRQNWLEVLLAEDLRSRVVEPIERSENLTIPTTTPVTTNWSVGPRLLAAFAERTMFGARPWTLKSGMVDGDYGADVRSELFEQIPWAAQHVERVALSDADRDFRPEWRFWFVTEDVATAGPGGKAHVAVDTLQGIAFTVDTVVELMPEYERNGRSIDRLVNLVCPPAS